MAGTDTPRTASNIWNQITDKSDTPVSAAAYELVLVDKDGNQVTRSGGMTTPEGISSQDVTFASPGSFNVRVKKR
jgi:hypothetical protein